jgi:hypothetical protein
VYLRIGATAAAVSLLLLATMLAVPRSALADVCQRDAFAIGANDFEDDACNAGTIFNDDARAEDTSSPFSFAFAYARAETSFASLEKSTYAWSFNTNTILGAALSSNEVVAASVPGTTFGSGSSAYAKAINDDSFLVLAGAENDVNLAGVSSTGAVFGGNIRSEATNTDCDVCSATSSNGVDMSGVTSGPNGVVLGGIYANANNTDASHAWADARNAVNIYDVTTGKSVLTDSNGSFALATNTGGPIINGECEACFAKAYNSLTIENVDVNENFMEAARAVGQNDYSSGSSAIGINVASFEDVVVSGTLGLQQAFGYGINEWSPDSTAVGINKVHIGGDDSDISVYSISDGSLWSEAHNYWCDECTAKSHNVIGVNGDVTGLTIFGGGAYANAYNEGDSLAPGFGDNTALASNVALLNDVSTTALLLGNPIITNSVYSNAENYTGGTSNDGSCYDCVAIADNFLKAADSSSGGPVIDGYVYANAENYDSDEVLAKSKNKLVIKDSTAAGSIIGGTSVASGSVGTTEVAPGDSNVFANTMNRYCYDCVAVADNSVLIQDTHSSGNVLNGSAYAWAENNLDDTLINSAGLEGEGDYNTAVAYNTLIIKDNGNLNPAAFALGDTVTADIYSCASNNAGGNACGECDRLGTAELVCERSVPLVAQEYVGACLNCNAFADNFVKVTDDSQIDINASQSNSISSGGVYARAENTAQGEVGEGICEDCTAKATNKVIATNGSLVNGPTSSDALNMDSADSTAISRNQLLLDGGNGHAETEAGNLFSEDSTALALNEATATAGGTVESLASATNTDSEHSLAFTDVSTTAADDGSLASTNASATNKGAEGSMALALGQTTASNGGTAENVVQATTGTSGDPGVAVAVGMSNAAAPNTNAVSTSTADMTNDGTSTGVAYSVSFDASGNVAVAVVATNNGAGVAVSYTNATGNNTSEADADASGSGSQGGDINFQTGDPTADTDVHPTP